MVKITNGVNVLEVTRGAFDGYYKCQGYHEMVTDTKKVSVTATPEISDMEDDGLDDKAKAFISELSEKPLSQWNKSEVRRYAELKNIDITGTRTIGDAKAIIQASMEG